MRRLLMVRKLNLAWRLYIRLNHSWRLAWHIAAYHQAQHPSRRRSREQAPPIVPVSISY